MVPWDWLVVLRYQAQFKENRERQTVSERERVKDKKGTSNLNGKNLDMHKMPVVNMKSLFF